MSSDSRQLHYKQFGDAGPVYIILHGLLGSCDNWQTPAKKLAAAGRRVYVPDMRNHGGSFHAGEMDYPTMAEDVHRLVRGLGAGPALVIGHSMGGKIGMELALSYQEDVEKLVVVDISPYRYKPLYANVFTALRDIDVTALSARSRADRQLREKVPDRLVRLFLLKNLRRDDRGAFSWKINLEALANNYHHIWAGIDTSRTFNKPVLFLEGENSEAGIKLQFEEIKKTFPRAEYSMVPGAGHWLHAEKPREFHTAVTDFFGD